MRAPATSRRIVVDTNVAFSASDTVHPVSSACRQTMETMFEQHHRVVLSATQLMEWLKHQSGYSKRWLVQMKARKLWHVLTPEPDSGLSTRVRTIVCTEEIRHEMLKDLHLLENALATDKVVLSMETNALQLFVTHKKQLKLPHPIAWVNPSTDIDSCIKWLQLGAPVAKVQIVPAAK